MMAFLSLLVVSLLLLLLLIMFLIAVVVVSAAAAAVGCSVLFCYTGLVLPKSDIDTVLVNCPANSITILGRALYGRQNKGEVRILCV